MSFFDAIRPMFGGKLTQDQVDGIGETINVFEEKGDGDVRKLAYILATGFHEAKFKPVRENMKYTAPRIREVWPSRFKNVEAARPYANNPQLLANKVYGGRLGNNKDNDGWLYRGGGWPQLTGKANYAKFGLDKDPDRILEPKVSAWVLVAGMLGGKFTGKKLSEFITPTRVDYVGARAVVNDDVKANGERIAGYAVKFEHALRTAMLPERELPDRSPAPIPVPGRLEPAPAVEPAAPKRGGIPSWLLWVAAIFLAAAAGIAIFL